MLKQEDRRHDKPALSSLPYTLPRPAAHVLCINQGDEKDKETQVQLMGRICSKARRALIWLDEDTQGTGGASGWTMQLDSYFTSLYCKRRVTNLLPAFRTWMTILNDAFSTSKVPAGT